MAGQIVVAVLDVGGAHKGDDPEYPCEMRIAQHPDGYWYCVDCGMTIPVKRVGVDTEGGALEFDYDTKVMGLNTKEQKK